MRIAIGVNMPKNINPSIIGLTIYPKKKPRRIHDLFNGKRVLGRMKEILKKIADNIINIIPMFSILLE
tara:strand:+ start:59 stop:262 length:204 start_codon:yes stop_codon:yes gene_type:complete